MGLMPRNRGVSRNKAARRIRFIRAERSFTDWPRNGRTGETRPGRNAPVSFCLVRIHDAEGTRRLAANVLDRRGWHLRTVSTLIRRTAVTIPWHLALINAIGPHALACTRVFVTEEEEKKGAEVSERKVVPCYFDVSLSDFRERRTDSPSCLPIKDLFWGALRLPGARLFKGISEGTMTAIERKVDPSLMPRRAVLGWNFKQQRLAGREDRSSFLLGTILISRVGWHVGLSKASLNEKTLGERDSKINVTL